jgi:hypothetical protein
MQLRWEGQGLPLDSSAHQPAMAEQAVAGMDRPEAAAEAEAEAGMEGM